MDTGARTYWLPFMVSFIGHVLLFFGVVFSPDLAPKRDFMPAVIDVSMVTLKTASPAEKAAPESKAPEKAPVAKPTEKKTETTAPKVPVPPEPKPEPKVSTAKPTPKPAKRKASLKRKTFKPNKVVKRAIKKIEKNVAKSNADAKSKALERLRKQVKKDETSRATAPTAGAAAARSTGGGKEGATGRRRAELIDMYRIEIAYRVQEHWAFSEQLAGNTGKIRASIVFKVLPSGEIIDIFYVDRSGNAFLDESAYKAIVKANPVDPHPKGIIEPYVMVGLNFTPEGVR
ncbi:MAG: cell envelope integrity protein TolA [Desulfosarcinaceae bacterium]|nr:cell envelope integrity protein TolA [Desulfosarcinaceae bacterium]